MSLMMMAVMMVSIGADGRAREDALDRLGDPSHFVRLHAAAELGEGWRNSKAEIRALAAALLDDPNEMVRFYAADALGKIGPAAGIVRADLMKAFGDESWIVRRKVAIALGVIGVAEDDYFDRLRELYPEVDSQPHPQLILLYLAEDPPPSTVKYKPEDLTDKRWDIRLLALRHFWALREREHAATILGLLKDENIAVRGMAIALFDEGDEDAQRAIYFQRTYLSSGDFRIRARIRSIQPDDFYSLVSVRRLYAHGNEGVHWSLLNLIKRMEWKDEETIEFLKRMATGEDPVAIGQAVDLLDERMITLD